MYTYEVLSLISAIFFAIALWSNRFHLESNIIYYFQIISYSLLLVSSWMIGYHSTAFVLGMCIITLFLKIVYKYSSVTMLLFSIATLVGGLLLNNHGWVGLLPVIAAVGVVARHVYRYREHMPLGLFPKDMWDDIRKHTWVVLSKVDNANRMPGHVFNLFMENIVGVILWAWYAKETGDNYQLYLRGIMLFLNLLDYFKRLIPLLKTIAYNVLPSSKRNVRRGMAIEKRKRKVSWVI